MAASSPPAFGIGLSAPAFYRLALGRRRLRRHCPTFSPRRPRISFTSPFLLMCSILLKIRTTQSEANTQHHRCSVWRLRAMAAAATALGILELVEKVVVLLPPQDCLHIQRVSTIFRNTGGRSQTCQQVLFLHAEVSGTLRLVDATGMLSRRLGVRSGHFSCCATRRCIKMLHQPSDVELRSTS